LHVPHFWIVNEKSSQFSNLTPALCLSSCTEQAKIAFFIKINQLEEFLTAFFQSSSHRHANLHHNCAFTIWHCTKDAPSWAFRQQLHESDDGL